MHGKIYMESDLGVGTTVTVELTLPLVEASSFASEGTQMAKPFAWSIATASSHTYADSFNEQLVVL